MSLENFFVILFPDISSSFDFSFLNSKFSPPTSYLFTCYQTLRKKGNVQFWYFFAIARKSTQKISPSMKSFWWMDCSTDTSWKSAENWSPRWGESSPQYQVLPGWWKIDRMKYWTENMVFLGSHEILNWKYGLFRTTWNIELKIWYF